MKVQVLYFAALREQLGVECEEVELAESATAADLLKLLAERGNAWTAIQDGVGTRLAINQEFAEPEASLSDGDEVGLFPPVTGG